METEVVIVGFGGHAKSIADSIEEKGEYKIVGYTDCVKNMSSPYEYLGDDDILSEIYKGGVLNAVVGVGYLGSGIVRDNIYTRLKKIGFILPPIIDSTAIIAENVIIGEGTIVGKRAVINTDTQVGKMCIVNTGVILEHENTIMDYSHIAAGAVLCGNVFVEDHVFIGAGSTVIHGVKVDKDAIIAAGAVVIRNVNKGTVVAGVPAQMINKKMECV